MAIERAQALVIEDSPEITLLVRGLLEKEGYSVVATPRGIQGLEWARAKKPELVILDLSLPDRDGVEVCRELRSFSDAYVVMVTARDDEVDKIVGRRLRHQAVLAARARCAHPCDASPAARDQPAGSARLRSIGGRPGSARGHGGR